MRILWLKTELLHPVDKGGKIRTYQMLKELKRQHHITYLCLDETMSTPAEREQALEYCHEVVCVPHQTRAKFSPGFYSDLALNVITPLPYFIKKYESLPMRRKLRELTLRSQSDVLVCDFLVSSVNVPPALPCATVLFQHNVEEIIWKRHYEVQKNKLKKAYLYSQWRKTRAYERAACRRFGHVIAVSREDREIMQSDYGVTAIDDVPTGVDIDFFKRSGREVEDPHDIVFTGSMDWLPNEDAIRYFTERIMPLVKVAIPNITLTVVGRNPYPGLVELSKRDPSIIVTGRVEDVRPYMERAAAFIVPLRIGGGTRLKIFEAMALEKAIVSTSVGAEGLPVSDGNELRIADTPEAFAAAVVELLKNPELAKRIGQQAAKTVREKFGWAGVAKRFTEICETTIQEHGNLERTSAVEVRRHEQPAA
ncbi:MAG TPA: glycosyltransferase [Pyrinomonadaceae bacterium]|nr:glycosyltransferase [Pyrinomonadaceae bacterium]